jgi:indole-3-glycerol phosphate synthase
MILDEIVAHKRTELLRRQAVHPLAEVRRCAEAAPPALDFAAALRGPDVRLIAEVKKASPSRGLLRPNFDPASLAHTYVAHGAAAISVLTDERFFQGHLDHLRLVREAIKRGQRGQGGQMFPLPPLTPLLRKDFTLDVYHIYQARAAGADAVLLIAALLERHQLADFQTLAHELGMAALVEVHAEWELDKAMWAVPDLVGINNRDLRTFQTDLTTCLHLRPRIPTDTIVVAESGITARADVERLAGAGIDAILVGEALVTADDVGAKVEELTGVNKFHHDPSCEDLRYH